MYTIKNISEILGWTARQIYDRMNEIENFTDKFTQRGKKNRILVDQRGFKLLKRIHELENDHFSIKEATNKAEEELHNHQTNNTLVDSSNELYNELIVSYKERIDELNRQVNEKDRLISWFQTRYDKLIEKVKLQSIDTQTPKLIEYPT